MILPQQPEEVTEVNNFGYDVAIGVMYKPFWKYYQLTDGPVSGMARIIAM